ncbi:hypothetical protein ACFE04_026860 [Oxalis oulophora]
MDHKRLSRESSLQKKLAQARRPISKNDNVHDVDDVMSDVFFGEEKKAYNDEEDGFDDSTRSNSSRTTQEWLEEARRMVASSPSRCESPSRLGGSPRFAAQGRFSPSSLDRRDPLSRSARRHRAVESFSGEILTKSAKHSRNKSDIPDIETESPSSSSPADAVHKWFSNFLKSPPSDINTPPTSEPSSPRTNADQTAAPTLPPRQPNNRKSRFQTDTPAILQQGVAVPSRRTFKTLTENTQLLSPPKNPVEPKHQRTLSNTSNGSFSDNKLLSPPRNLVESAHRRSISKSTCAVEKTSPNPSMKAELGDQEEPRRFNEGEKISINEFLKQQRTKVERILNGELNSKAKIVLPGHSNS